MFTPTNGDDASVALKDIAEAAGVSVSSVSRALSGRGDLGQETRARIVDLADRMGYRRPDAQRGRPRTLDPRLIELVLGTFADAWTNEVVAGARRSAFTHGYDLVLTLERDDPDDDWPIRVAARRPSGVVLGLILPTARQMAHLRGLNIPIVLLDPQSDPHGELPSVGTTDWQGGYDAGRHLARAGLTRFIFIAGSPPYRFGRAREDGFRRAIEEHVVSATIDRVTTQWTGADVTSAFRGLLRGTHLPVGVFAANDEMALAAYRAADALGLTIPDHLSVIGFNDEPRAARAAPSLTSVRQPVGEMAARAVELIGEIQEFGIHDLARVELPTRLVVRDSTAALHS